MAQLAAAADVGIYRAARQIIDMARRPFRLNVEFSRLCSRTGYSRQWYSGQGAELRRIVSQIGHDRGLLADDHVGIAGWACAARHISASRIIGFVLGDGFAEASPVIWFMMAVGLSLAPGYGVDGRMPIRAFIVSVATGLYLAYASAAAISGSTKGFRGKFQ